jgi:hypothetical protein
MADSWRGKRQFLGVCVLAKAGLGNLGGYRVFFVPRFAGGNFDLFGFNSEAFAGTASLFHLCDVASGTVRQQVTNLGSLDGRQATNLSMYSKGNSGLIRGKVGCLSHLTNSLANKAETDNHSAKLRQW